jgi:hypothetical protein
MVRSHNHSGAVDDHGLDMTLQKTTRGAVNARERLVEQKKVGMPHPRASEEHAPQLPVR